MEKTSQSCEPGANSISDQENESKSKVISAEELDLSLDISDEVIKEFDQIKKERLKATIEDPVFICD